MLSPPPLPARRAWIVTLSTGSASAGFAAPPAAPAAAARRPVGEKESGRGGAGRVMPENEAFMLTSGMGDGIGLWTDVDAACEAMMPAPPESVTKAAARCEELGLPAISVSPLMGRWLMGLARLVKAQRVVEVGTLGGYSTAWLAEGLAPGGKIISIEIDPVRAAEAERTFRDAGLADRIEVRCGAGQAELQRLLGQWPAQADLVFIDADKENSGTYVELALKLTRAGGVIVVDNVIRDGAITDPDHADSRVQGSRDAIARLAAGGGVMTVLQTVGRKGYDGFAMAVMGERGD